MPGRSQAQMIQMLAALSQIQLSRREQDRLDQQFQEQKNQFAQQMGFQEKSEEYKKVTNLIDTIAKSSAESRSALYDLGTAMGLPQDQMQALTHYGQSAPETVEMIRQRAATNGYNNASPVDRAQMDTNAAYGATTGQTRGGINQSDMIGMLAGGQSPQQLTNQFAPDVLQSLIRGFAQRAATNQTPFEAAGQAGIMNQAPAAAMVASGLAPSATANQQAAIQREANANQFTIGQGNIAADYYRTNAQMIANAGEMQAKLMAARSTGGITPSERNQAIQQMHTIVEAMQKDKNESTLKFNMALYNNLAAPLGIPQMTDPAQAPQAASILEKASSALVPPGPPAPPSTLQPNPMALQQSVNPQQQFILQYMQRGNPMANPQAMQQFMQPNPLSPFVPRP